MKKKKHGSVYKDSVGGYFRMFDKVPSTRYKAASLHELGVKMSANMKFGLAVPTSNVAAGLTYLGQFIDHDITRMRRSGRIPKDGPVDVNRLIQERSPILDLDSLYGGGLTSKTVRYTPEGKFFSEYLLPNGNIYDLPRGMKADDYSARIGDDRNDENFIIAQLHVLFMNLHNKLIDLYLGQESLELGGELQRDIVGIKQCREKIFDQARREVILLYQSIVVNEFLHSFLDEQVWNHLFCDACEAIPRLISRRFQCEEARIPVEFSGAAFRFGHSLVRDTYFIRSDLNKLSLTTLFKLTGRGKLNGEEDLSKYQIDWSLFFDMPKSGRGRSGLFNKATIIWPNVVSRLKEMINEKPGNQNLLSRNLLRGKELDLPCAQDVIKYICHSNSDYADATGLQVLSERKLLSYPSVGSALVKGLETKTPLWVYILMEPLCQRIHNIEAYEGDIDRIAKISGLRKKLSRLGKLGSIIVGETFLSLLESSPISVHADSVDWSKLKIYQYLELEAPEHGTNSGVSMSDIVEFVG